MLIQFSHSILSSGDANDPPDREIVERKIVMDFVPWILDFSPYLRFFFSVQIQRVSLLSNLFFLFFFFFTIERYFESIRDSNQRYASVELWMSLSNWIDQ